MSDAFATSWMLPNRLFCLWDFPGKNTRVNFHFLLQGIFLTQGSTPFQPDRQILHDFSSVQFSSSFMYDYLRPHGLQHTRPSCPSPTLGVYSNSCSLSPWCHPTISSFAVPFFSHLQSLPASGFFQLSQFFASVGQSIGVSASSLVLPMNIEDWFPLGWTGWISLQSKGISRVFSNTTVQKHQFFGAQLSL